jgi:4-amino-4-deoxy-L-arabinose transferase-like glycosyltransferase
LRLAAIKRVLGLEERRLIWFFFLAVLFVRVLYVLAAPSYPSDAYKDYETIAENIVAGRGYSASPGFYGHTDVAPTAYFAPIYTYFYAAALYMSESYSDSYLLIRLVQCFVSAISVVLLFKIASRLFGRSTAFLTCMIFVIHPIYSHFVGQCSEATFVIMICLLCVHMSLGLAGRPSMKGSLLLGLAMGVAVLLNPSLSPGLLVLALYLAYTGRKRPLHTARNILAMVVLALLTVMPWTIRNYLVFNEFVFVKSSLGLNLWMGNNEFATGTPIFDGGDGVDFAEESRGAYPLLADVKSMNEARRDKVFMKAALSYMKDNPGRTVWLTVKKAFYFWIYDRYKVKTLARRKAMEARRALIWRGYAIVNVVMVGLCLAAVSLLWRRKDLNMDRTVILVFIFSISLVYMVAVVGHLRFRVPLEPFVQMFAMFAISAMAGRKKPMGIAASPVISP